jgi:hypothetical protein
MAELDLGYPLWLLISVLVVFAVLLYYMLRGRVSERLRAPLALVLAPLCTVAALAVAVVLSALLSPFYESPTDPAGPRPSTSPPTTPGTMPPEMTGPTASPPSSPTASPTASPTSSPSVSATASP